MTTVAISEVKDDGKRYTFVGIISNVRSRDYSGGQMLLFDVEDSTAALGGIVWNDSYNAFQDIIKQGDTFKFCAVTVKANPRNNNRLEIKMYADTRIERCEAIAIERTYNTIQDAKISGRDTVYIKGVVTDVSDQVESMRSGDEMRRGMMIDPTGEAPFFLLGSTVNSSLSKGDAVKFDGRLTSSGAIFVNVATVITDDALTSFFGTQTSLPSVKKQRVDPTISRILDVKSSDVGTRGEFNAIVRSRSAVGAPLANDRVKYTFVLVDPSMGAVEVGCFMNKTDSPEADVGDSVRLEATVSSFNTRSLTTNAVNKTTDTTLRQWYKDEITETTKFEEISIDTRVTADAPVTADA